jgi:hypothetical protein
MKRTSLLVAFCAVVSCAVYASAKPAHPYDGSWTQTITGESESCQGSINGNFMIANSRIENENGNGVISPSGEAHGTANGGGFTATWSGHFTLTTGAGRFKRNDGCVGHWEARKI